MNIRNVGFRLISKVKRTPVNSFIDEYDLDEKEKETLMEKRLANILKIANQNTEFYKDYRAFDDFPVIDKSVLRSHYDSFISKNADLTNSIKMTTSGSTGQPMTFHLSREKKFRQNAEVIFYNRWGALDVGDCHGYVRVTNAKSYLKLFIQNEYLMNPKSLTSEWLENQIDLLKKKKIKSLIGYPSAISAIAYKSIEQGNTPNDFSLKGIITSSESLQNKDAEAIYKAFGVKPISRYSTEEFGVLATSCPNCGKYHVNDTGYKVEILDVDSDTPVSPGEIGKVVVTDLFSDYMPLIRFDTGDLATLSHNPNSCLFYKTGFTLDNIVGRQIETIYDINKKPVSAFAINGSLRDFETIKQFQLIQNDYDSNVLYLVTTSNFSKDDEKIIEERFADILGTTIEIKNVEEITPLKSGKRPYIISKIKA